MNEEILLDIEECVRCGSCKALCPTHTLSPVEPLSARGRLMLVRALARGEIECSGLLQERLLSCLLCGVCESTCPAGVHVTRALFEGRREVARKNARVRRLGRLTARALKMPAASFRVARAARPLLPRLRKRGLLPFDLPLPDEAPLRKGGSRVLKPRGRPRGRVAVFTGCVVNFLMPHLGEALLRLLLAQGYEVVLPAGEACCGSPLLLLGREKEAVEMARRNLSVFGKLQVQAVLSLCPTCTVTLREHYPLFVGEGLARAMDATAFLHGEDLALLPEKAQGAAAFHDPCHLRYALGVWEEPRELMRRAGLDVLEAEQGCCGLSAALTHRETSEALLERRARAYAPAHTLVTACPGCMLQLSRVHGRVLHLVEVLEGAMREPREAGPGGGTEVGAARAEGRG
ncbi:MAG: (Fe-S)-binding protein [Nitrospirota bacterium]